MAQAPAQLSGVQPTSTAEALAATQSVCEQAMAQCGDDMRDIPLRFAGRPVQLHVAGPVLADHMTRTFEHLQDATAAQEEPALRIDMWDRKHTGLGCPGVPYIPDQTICLDAGLITHYLDQQVIRYERGHCTMVLDRANNHIYSCRNDGNDLALYERSKPFPIMLATWYQDQGIQQLHAGLVSKDGRGVLFIGASGSGKSTATLACALDGFDYLGDDHNGVRMDKHGRCRGYSYYNAAASARAISSTSPNSSLLKSRRIASGITKASCTCRRSSPSAWQPRRASKRSSCRASWAAATRASSAPRVWNVCSPWHQHAQSAVQCGA